MRISTIVVLLSLALCALFCVSVAASGAQHDLKVWMETPRHVFKEYELFSVYLFIVNAGSDSARVPFVYEKSDNTLKLQMRDSDGKYLRRSAISHPEDHGDVSLASGDTVMFKITPLEVFFAGGWKENTPVYIPVGSYELSGVYWSKYTLEPISLTVQELSETDREVVMDYYQTACRYTHGMERLSDCVQLWNRRGDTFLGSRIADLALGLAAGVSAPEEQRIHLAIETIEKHHDDGVLSTAFACLSTLLEDSVLVRTLHEHPEIRASKYSRFMLKEVSRQSGKAQIFEEVMAQ